MPEQQQNINVKIEDIVLKGSYANNMQVGFSPEEFILDFMNLFPPQGIVTNRIFISPGHMKRNEEIRSTVWRYQRSFSSSQFRNRL
jgi:hypothetical protein